MSRGPSATRPFIVESEADRDFFIRFGHVNPRHVITANSRRARKYFTRLHAEAALAVPVQTGHPSLLPSAERDATIARQKFFAEDDVTSELPRPAPQRVEPAHREFFSIGELAERWRCSRGTVYNRLRKAGLKVMDWADRGKKGKKAIRAADVYQIENQHMKRLV